MRFYCRAISYFRQDWILIVSLLACIGLFTGLELLKPWPVAIIVDSVLTAHPTKDRVHEFFLAMLPHGKLGQIIGVAIIGCLLKVVQDLLSLARNMLGYRINNWGTMRLRRALFAKLQKLSLHYHKTQPQGDAIYRLMSDAQGPEIIFNVLIGAVVDCVLLVVMTCIMFSRNVPLTLFALSVTPLFIWTNIAFGRRIKDRSISAKSVDTGLTSSIQRMVSNIGLIQAFGREGSENNDFGNDATHSARSWLNLNWQEQNCGFIVATIQSLGGLIIFAYGGYLVWRDQFAHPVPNGFNFGDVLVYMYYLGMLWNPLTRLTGVSPAIQKGTAGAIRVFEVLDRGEAITDPPNPATLPEKATTVQFDDVYFAYLPGRPTLHGINLSIEAGQIIAIVGPSGSGKTTLLSLLPRFYDPACGQVKIDGSDVRQVGVAELRQHIALVAQDSPLLPGTISHNIALGRPEATPREIQIAAHLAGVATFIEHSPEGYETQIAEGGGNLSGGQRQRLAIARALLCKAPILILDEPTSALDPQQERQVVQTLLTLKGQRTIILVSHHLSTVVDCDRIFVMERGRIVEAGTHTELLGNLGLYYRMVQQSVSPASQGISRAA